MSGFEYHTKCKGLKLNHLCFADDVLLFCKGTYQSVLQMLRGLQLSQGLQDYAQMQGSLAFSVPIWNNNAWWIYVT